VFGHLALLKGEVAELVVGCWQSKQLTSTTFTVGPYLRRAIVSMSTPYPLQLELHADGRITRWRPLVGTTGALLLADGRCSILF
jgi:hypothetical protein